VASVPEMTEIALQHGRVKKRNNAIAAILCGAVLAILLSFRFSASGKQWLLGLIVGLSWGNAFEYVYHRWLLHRPRNRLGAGHQRHHAQIGTPEEAEHVALITSPLNVFLLFAINLALAYPICFLLGLRGMLAGIFLGWTIYLIAAEEIHWRIHRNTWLPPGLRFARAYHMSHHDIPNSRYNVFLPLFDFLFGNTTPGKSKLHA
jgi:Fatty acid hydroxylase superfamily